MSQKNRNLVLLSIWIILMVATSLVIVLGGKESKFDFDEKKFALELNTVITTVNLESKEHKLNFEFIDGKWVINGEFEMDRGMRDVFFGVLSSVEIQRPVPPQASDSIAQVLMEEGVKVEILNNQQQIKEYYVSGDPIQDITYFMTEGELQPYYMKIPGYQSYIAGIFEAPVHDWKDRFIFETNWSSLKSLKLEHINNPEKNLELNFAGKFFQIEGKESIDSAKVFDYIQEISNFQVSRYLGENLDSRYDSLASTEPQSIIKLESIGQKPTTLEIFSSLAGQRLQLGRINGEEKVLIRSSQINKIYRSSDDLAN